MKYVVLYHEGGIVQDEAADEDVKVVHFDFDAIREDFDPSYIRDYFEGLLEVPPESSAFKLAQSMADQVIEGVESRLHHDGAQELLDKLRSMRAASPTPS